MAMDAAESRRYRLGTPEGVEEWSELLPRGGHLIRDMEESENMTYTLALFHQLRCLDILGQDYVSQTVSPLRDHCLNYIRQSILCIADARLEYAHEPL